MKDGEFKEIITDFDEFMRRHGYYTVKEISEYEGVTDIAVRQWIRRGIIKDTVNINGKRYIPFKYRIEHKKRGRRQSNGNTKTT